MLHRSQKINAVTAGPFSEVSYPLFLAVMFERSNKLSVTKAILGDENVIFDILLLNVIVECG